MQQIHNKSYQVMEFELKLPDSRTDNPKTVPAALTAADTRGKKSRYDTQHLTKTFSQQSNKSFNSLSYLRRV